MFINRETSRSGRWGATPHRWARNLAVAGMLLAVAGCDLDSLLDVEDVDVVTEESAASPEALPFAYAGAIRDFQIAFTGFPSSALDEGFVLASGMLSDEYDIGGTFPTRIEVDRRNIARDNGTMQAVFRKMQRARGAAERTARTIEVADATDPRRGEILNLAGFMYVFFGEMYCSGVPFSRIEEGQTVFGGPTPTNEIFDRAIGFFDQVLNFPQATASQRNMALLGKGRALLNLNQVDQAANLVADVPTAYVYWMYHSDNSTTQNNGIWAGVNNVKRYRVTDRHGDNGLPYRSANDPRVPWFIPDPPTAFDATLTAYSQGLYLTRDANIPVTRGLEARLIQAEAALRQGAAGVPQFVTIHNALRATVDGLDPLVEADVAAMTQDQRVDLHFQEKAFWTWQTGHRLGDMRRLMRQYNRDQAGAGFGTGPHYKGDNFGTDVNFPIPIEEDANPNAVACLDRNP
jgi:starch-binding outer membrane protein, SusD/RagB family